MSTPSTPLRPLAVSEANFSIRVLFRWFRERVDTLSTIHLRGVEAQDAKERFEELQRHASVLKGFLRTVGRWMDVEVVQLVVAIVSSEHLARAADADVNYVLPLVSRLSPWSTKYYCSMRVRPMPPPHSSAT
ncbi:hypothetical protein NUW54_g14509 [Trametes sanguinea]|uniref:Uncharacterized protein n=1 Tax=Trametes sanguinea TaxID=158606 RepID=A0ACC1MBQ6_9APHY|nr:hypothetical protein NUW54_g14509 [Trametes sanguinea]